jgi:hypothetical protein
MDIDMARHATPTASPTVRSRTVRILREPFLAATWKRVAHLLLAVPVGILCVPLALVSGPAGRIQRGLARRLLGLEVEEPERTGPLALAHAVISLPLNVAAVTVTVYFWTLVPLNLGRPLREVLGLGTADPEKDWGGPTFAGAWAVHAIGGGVTLPPPDPLGREGLHPRSRAGWSPPSWARAAPVCSRPPLSRSPSRASARCCPYR